MDDQIDIEALGRRAGACKGWRWLSGMLLLGSDDQRARQRDADWWNENPAEFAHLLPDLSDPATLGCLLALVREAWGCDEWRRLTVEPAGAGWCVVVRVGRHRPPSRARPGWELDKRAHPRYRNVESPLGQNEFDSEAEALVAALELAP